MAVENLYIFDGFSQEEIAYFLLMSQTQVKKKGERILALGEPSNGCAYYIKSGHVKVMYAGDEIAVLGPDSFFGEFALITDEPRTATVEAIDDVELHIFLKDDFLTLLEQSKHSEEMKEEILRRMRNRIHR